MGVRYTGPNGDYPIYCCRADRRQRGAALCQEARAPPVDAFVESPLLDALAPDQIAIAWAAVGQLEAETRQRKRKNFPFSYASGGYFFVHVGVDPDQPLDGQSQKTMITIRDPFLRMAHRLGCTVGHGHVPDPKGPMVAPGQSGVDTGTYAIGILTAVALSDRAAPRFMATACK